MLRNYLTIAFRSLFKNKVISVINIVGLSVGLACFALFALYVLNEYSFDRFHKNADRLYAVYEGIGEISGMPAQKLTNLPMPLGPALKADLPDVERFARLQGVGETFLVRTASGIVEEKACYADPAFFDMFSFPFVYGHASSALAAPNNVVLTEKMAHKLFGEANPTGKTVEINILGGDRFEPFTVSGIAQDLPSNSTIQFGIVMPFEKFAATERGKAGATDWGNLAMQTFVELRPGSGLANDQKRLDQFFLKYYPDVEKSVRDNGLWNKPEPPVNYGLVSIQSLHHDPVLGINPALSLILLGIGGIILLIACINFTTLSIGRSAGRAREIGMRKVIGASRAQLAKQYLVEAVLLSGISTAVGLALAMLLLPVFNALTDKQLAFNFQQFPELFWLVPGLAVVVGLLAGSYPAFVLSGFSSLETLKNKLKIDGENWFTKSLVTFQFVLSVGLMACTFIMLRQMHFLRSKDLGFNQENVVVVSADGSEDPTKTLARFRQALANRPEIAGIGSAELSLGAGQGLSNVKFAYQGQDKILFEYAVNEEYLRVLNMPLVSGRNFDPGIVSDSVTSVILNESAVREFGWTNETALGQVLTGYNMQDPKRDPVVIGVSRDFHYRSLHEKVYPMMFNMFHDRLPWQFFVRLAPGDPRPALDHMKSAWAGVEPILPFRYVFLDENLRKFYVTETRMSTTIGWAGGIAVFLACLGLFGLATLSTHNRTKEIGIRKVLGASVAAITALLTKDFLKLVVVAIVLATPIAYYFMQQWLADFAYRIDMSWWMFALAGAAAVVVAFLTVGYQSVRAGLANPVESLRRE
ncbi:MAG: ABC transporter permease [Saprospiraceae bacterium]|nr:ABC transporter permease [Saprospiraceae bacterium]